LEQAYRKMVKQIAIPGFRKGKTPRPVFEKFVGKEALYSEAIEYFVPDAYMQAVEESGIYPVAQPEFDIGEFEEGREVRFKAVVKVKPTVTLGQYKGLEVAKTESEITEDDVLRELAKLQERHAQLISLETGIVENEDIAIIDFIGRRDGEEFEGGQATDYSLEIGKGTFIPGFEEQLLGMQVGETKEINVTFPEDYHTDDLKGADVVFTVSLKSIKRKELAPLDDEFAKDVSEFDTLEELREDVLNKLKETAENIIQQRIKGDALRQATENAQVDIHEEMIDSRVEEIAENVEKRIATQGLSMENYLLYTGSNSEEFKESLREEAKEDVKVSLVLEAIVEAEGIEVSEEEVDKEIQTMATNYQQDPQMLRRILEGKKQLPVIKNNLQQQKAVDLIATHVVLIDAPAALVEQAE